MIRSDLDEDLPNENKPLPDSFRRHLIPETSTEALDNLPDSHELVFPSPQVQESGRKLGEYLDVLRSEPLLSFVSREVETQVTVQTCDPDFLRAHEMAQVLYP